MDSNCQTCIALRSDIERLTKHVGKADKLLQECRDDIERLTKERDAAIAHDRQPYPTAEAYEAVCKAYQFRLKQSDALRTQLTAAHTALRHLLDATAYVHCTSPPDYAWSECGACGKEDGHEPDCAVVKARAILTTQKPI